ncbi:MAG: hypothetical protein ING28_03395 [Roseomonas sp.]|nr:hypothetical protein [Roseomonas sp.]
MSKFGNGPGPGSTVSTIDATFYLQIASGNPLINFDALDFLYYDRDNNKFYLIINGLAIFEAMSNDFIFHTPPRVPSFTVATLPSAASLTRGLIYVSNGTLNKRIAVSDGTNWRWPDGAIVS